MSRDSETCCEIGIMGGFVLGLMTAGLISLLFSLTPYCDRKLLECIEASAVVCAKNEACRQISTIQQCLPIYNECRKSK